MTGRWKTALKFGITWGILMSGFTLLFDSQEKPVAEIINSAGFWIKSAGYTLIGIFPVGYFSVGKRA